MKQGFCFVAERVEPSHAVRKITASFSRAGVVLTNPHTRRTTELADDGEQVETTEVGLLEAVVSRPQLSFQLWFSSDTDVSCSFRQIASGLVRYSLDGLDAQERERLMRWAVDHFREAAVDGMLVLLVGDPRGTTAEVDWDATATRRIALPTTLPAILGLPVSWVTRQGDCSDYSRERIEGYELLSAPEDPVRRILEAGTALTEHGSNNWALTRAQALVAISAPESSWVSSMRRRRQDERSHSERCSTGTAFVSVERPSRAPHN